MSDPEVNNTVDASEHHTEREVYVPPEMNEAVYEV